MNLDRKFGPCRDAEGSISSVEMEFSPSSLQRLTPSSSISLKTYMKSAEEGLLITQSIHKNHNLLWVVDESGEVWFAIEEAVVADGSFLFPFPRKKHTLFLKKGDVDFAIGKLGHPSLLRNIKKSRIAGEIIFDVAYSDTSKWVINNASGRYGIRKHIRRSHLEAVGQIFNRFGIPMGIEFIPAP
jgi:hypothetical protein